MRQGTKSYADAEARDELGALWCCSEACVPRQWAVFRCMRAKSVCRSMRVASQCSEACVQRRRRTEDTLGRRLVLDERSKAQVADLDDSRTAVDKDIIALEVAVDNGRVVTVQVHQALQHLPGPALEDALRDLLVLLTVPVALLHNSDVACLPVGWFYT